MSRIRIRFLITAVVLGLLATACYLPAFWAEGGFFEGGTEIRGIRLLLFGPIFCPMTLPWLANVALFIAIRFLWKNQTGKMLAASSIAVLLALAPLYALREESLFILAGYWFWLASMVAIFIAAVGLRLFATKPQVALVSQSNAEDYVPRNDGVGEKTDETPGSDRL